MYCRILNLQLIARVDPYKTLHVPIVHYRIVDMLFFYNHEIMLFRREYRIYVSFHKPTCSNAGQEDSALTTLFWRY